MPAVKSDNAVSERLLNINWGKPDSNRQPAVAPQRDLRGKNVCCRIDEVFQHINAYRAIIDAGVTTESLLAKSLISQANAIFNEAFVNLERRYAFARVFVDAPLGARNGAEDITEIVIQEITALQNILSSDA